MFFVWLCSSSWPALLSAAFPRFLPLASSLPFLPGQHPRCVNPYGLLFGPASCLLPLGRISCSSCSLLPRATGEPGVRRLVHLRRFMRLLLFCGVNLLYSYSRERNRPASDATIGMSDA